MNCGGLAPGTPGVSGLALQEPSLLLWAAVQGSGCQTWVRKHLARLQHWAGGTRQLRALLQQAARHRAPSVRRRGTQAPRRPRP